jgi:N-acetylglucosamine-6-phosphate deacetylase
MEAADLAVMLDAADRLPNVMVTVAPENTSTAQITAMSEAGIVVSLGHTDAGFETCMAAFAAGARCVTHLFNAMSQLGNREPGLVGAALAQGDVYAGMIADGIHVHPQTLRFALAAKCHPERLFLVTDAMAAAGSSITEFTLNGREIYRKDHRLTLADGTLAGADLAIPRALSVMVGDVGDDLAMAIARTSAIPAQLLRRRGGLGALNTVGQAIYMADDLSNAIPLTQAG